MAAVVSRVCLTNVRSRRSLRVQFGPGLTVLVGPNGIGKTTVLEALALVLQGGPLRSGPVRDLITQGQDHLRVEIDIQDGGTALKAAAAYSRNGERRLTADGAQLDDSSRWREILPIRTFIPDDLRLVKGSPRRRREYLDMLVGRVEPAYRDTLSRYEEALAQRNALLRMVRGWSDGAQFGPWEHILAETGLEVSQRRAAALASFAGLLQRVHWELTGDPPEALRVVYRTNVAGLDEDGYRERLEGSREGDRQRTFTHLGPHRDDLLLVRNGIDVRDCASQGEQRAALLALVLAEWEYRREGAQRPLLMLDDVMSELDETRRNALVAGVRGGGQVIMTTTDLRYFSAEGLRQATIVELTAE